MTESAFGLYLSRQATSPWRYVWEQLLTGLLGWIPSVVGVGLRAFVYRLMMQLDGIVAIENGVRLRFADNMRLGKGVYLDQGVYLHACPGGIEIGANTYVMHNAELHVYNFRELAQSGICIGHDSLIGESCIVRGTGGVTIGDRVYLSPMVHIYSNNHIVDDPDSCFIDQGLTCEGVAIKDECWIGAMSVILDGVTVGYRSVVAAGSVVTRDVPPHSVVAGVPARVIRDLRQPKDGIGSDSYQPSKKGKV